jgi:hypothetical protein
MWAPHTPARDCGASVGDMTDEPAARTLLTDSFDRIRGLVVDLTDSLTEEVATYRPDDEANSIAWLVWHLTRIQDDHVAALAGVDQAWPHWRESFKLPFGASATGYGQNSHDVAAVRVDGDLLGKYHGDVHDLTMRYLATLTDEELARVVDTRWDPPVTASARLVSVIGDTLQHLGQAAYVRGLAKRRDRAWWTRSSADR